MVLAIALGGAGGPGFSCRNDRHAMVAINGT